MPSIDLAKLTKAELLALIAKMAVETAEPSEAQQHWENADLAVTCCAKTFRVEGTAETGGRVWHLAHTAGRGKHPKGKAK